MVWMYIAKSAVWLTKKVRLGLFRSVKSEKQPQVSGGRLFNGALISSF